MLFSSTLFLTLFLPFSIIAYWLCGQKLRNLFLLLISLVFYAWGEPIFVFILFGVSIFNYLLGKELAKNKKRLVIYIGLNLGLLIFCKYLPATIHQFQDWLGVSTNNQWNLTLKMPLGVSFYVFHAISYGVLRYKQHVNASPSLLEFLLYLFLFPHQIAGPIVAYNVIEQELSQRNFNSELFVSGMKKFALGLGKKAILSNGFSTIILLCESQAKFGSDAVFAWIEILAYTFHIYFDFSGYSDMAIGLARIFGFHFPENFNKPYISKSITEFWQRWHISLGSFMREFLYIPLGGNRKGTNRTLFNLGLVFLISGIWHGANWTFVVWGIFHGTFIILERLFLLKLYQRIKPISWFITWLIVMHGWIFFHETSIQEALYQFEIMWSFKATYFVTTGQDVYLCVFFSLGMFILLIEYLIETNLSINRLWTSFKNNTWLSSAGAMLIYFISYSFIIAGNENPFIYFNF